VQQQRVLADRYQLQVSLGRGATGQVWRAWDEHKRRTVAVKIVHVGQMHDPDHVAETVARFRREVMAVGKLRHANIVTAYEAGRSGGDFFLVMELADGSPLTDVIEQRNAKGLGLFPVPSVLAITEQVCAGLGAAHAMGVVHRDIKPSNLMVCKGQQIKIIDFGIARLVSDKSPQLTRVGQQIGTLAYMSPEQLEGKGLDHRADLYSVGCMVYELLAGRQPFTGELAGALIKQQLFDQPVPLRERRPVVPEALERLVSDLMAKSRDERPASAQAVIDRISAMRAPSEPAPQPRDATQVVDVAGESSRPTVLGQVPGAVQAAETSRPTARRVVQGPDASRPTVRGAVPANLAGNDSPAPAVPGAAPDVAAADESGRPTVRGPVPGRLQGQPAGPVPAAELGDSRPTVHEPVPGFARAARRPRASDRESDRPTVLADDNLGGQAGDEQAAEEQAAGRQAGRDAGRKAGRRPWPPGPGSQAVG
jgi:eukaryotic-like serine/threonine-protein kinase